MGGLARGRHPNYWKCCSGSGSSWPGCVLRLAGHTVYGGRARFVGRPPYEWGDGASTARQADIRRPAGLRRAARADGRALPEVLRGRRQGARLRRRACSGARAAPEVHAAGSPATHVRMCWGPARAPRVIDWPEVGGLPPAQGRPGGAFQGATSLRQQGVHFFSSARFAGFARGRDGASSATDMLGQLDFL